MSSQWALVCLNARIWLARGLGWIDKLYIFLLCQSWLHFIKTDIGTWNKTIRTTKTTTKRTLWGNNVIYTVKQNHNFAENEKFIIMYFMHCTSVSDNKHSVPRLNILYIQWGVRWKVKIQIFTLLKYLAKTPRKSYITIAKRKEYGMTIFNHEFHS